MASNLSLCEFDSGLKEVLKKFKFRKEKNNAAVVLKIDKNTRTVVVEEEFEDLEDIEQLQGEITETQPRYLLLSYVYKRDDGRVSYPLMLIFISPPSCKMDITMLYTGTKKALVDLAEVTKVFDIRDLSELTEDYLLEKLAFFK